MNLHDEAPANCREVIFTLTCAGIGAESVRWGAPDDPTLTCGATMRLPFNYKYNLQPIAVSLPAGVQQSYIEYELAAVAAAPAAGD